MENKVRLELNIPEFSLFEADMYPTDDYMKEQCMIPVTKEGNVQKFIDISKRFCTKVI